MLPQNYIQEEEGKNLKDYVRIILRRKWIIIAFLVVFVTIGTLQSYKKVIPIYRATVKIMFSREQPNVVLFQGRSYNYTDYRNYQTQLKILTSRSLARRTIKALNLKDSPEFKPVEKGKSFSIRGFLSSLVKKPKPGKELPETKSQIPDKDVDDSGIVSRFLSKLSVEALEGSYLVNVSFTGRHPDIIKEIVNKHAQEYINKNLELKFAASQDAIDWLQKQLSEKKGTLENTERALLLYKEDKKIVSLEDRQNIIVKELESLKSSLIGAKTERVSQEILCNQIKKYANNPEMIEYIPDVMENAIFQQWKTEYISLQSEINKLSIRYGEKHPKIVKLVSHAQELERVMSTEVKKITKGIETRYEMVLAREENLAKAFEEQEKIAQDLNRKAISYGTLMREAESERAMYDVLLKRMKETDITEELQSSSISIIDLAEVPKFPINAKTKNKILFAVLIGLGLGVGVAILLEHFDNTIKSAEEVERYMGLPVLGVLERLKVSKNGKQNPTELIADEMPMSAFAEAVKNIRTGIIFSSTNNSRKSILITSATQGEGKTFVASNLAIAIAHTGKNTLLVETDFRRPRINKIFNVEMNPGLSNHLVGESDLESVIKSTSISNLSIVTCGNIPPNPSEMLGSVRMEEFCKIIREKFDTILFDTPPSMTVTDAVVLSNVIDEAVFVIKSGKTARETAKRATLQISKNKCKVLGVVVNFIDVSRGSYYYHYYSGYHESGDNGKETSKKAEKV